MPEEDRVIENLKKLNRPVTGEEMEAIHKTGTQAQKAALWKRLVTEVAIQASVLGKTTQDIEEDLRREWKKRHKEEKD
jgi:hypothetical protein